MAGLCGQLLNYDMLLLLENILAIIISQTELEALCVCDLVERNLLIYFLQFHPIFVTAVKTKSYLENSGHGYSDGIWSWL